MEVEEVSTILEHDLEIIGSVRSQGISFGFTENISEVTILLWDVLEIHQFRFCGS
jgi:hypothetical protein